MRRLTVRREALAELSAADLVAVAGGMQTQPNCKIPTVWDTCICMTHVPPPTGMC